MSQPQPFAGSARSPPTITTTATAATGASATINSTPSPASASSASTGAAGHSGPTSPAAAGVGHHHHHHQHHQHHHPPRHGNRHSADFRLRPPPPTAAPPALSPPIVAAANGGGGGPHHGPLPVPVGQQQQQRPGNGHHSHDPQRPGAAAAAAFSGPRSPPNAKNTSHVPCKFFRQGACQAGKACPFLHSESMGPCKYYQRGNCKFGLRCANDHITANGQRINKPAHLQMNAHLNLGGRVLPTQLPTATNSLLSLQHDQLIQTSQPLPHPKAAPEDYLNPWKMGSYDIPTIDTTTSSLPGSAYGSPQNDSFLGKSPAVKGLSVLEAPLPASFDSQGISIFARTGPIAASVPARFGLEGSSPASLPVSRPLESVTLRNLHSSAFGDDARNGRAPYMMASSPSAAPEDGVGRRIMHSERFSSGRSKMMLSSSVGARRPLDLLRDDEWDENFVFEEDLVPNSLNDLLTPAERMRRLSRTTADDEGAAGGGGSSAIPFASSHRAAAFSGLGTPGAEATSPKQLGSSPLLGASPNGGFGAGGSSRFGPLFARPSSFAGRERNGSWSGVAPAGGREDAANGGGTAGGVVGDNVFGHVGSPLRPSPLNPSASAGPGSSPLLKPAGSGSRPVSADFSVSSPPRMASMSIISQQLQRVRVSSAGALPTLGRGGAAGASAPGSAADAGGTSAAGYVAVASAAATMTMTTTTTVVSAGTPAAASSSPQLQAPRLDRTASTTSSAGGAGAGVGRIDEEPALFDMDEVEAGKWKRLSGGVPGGGGARMFGSVVGVIGGRRAASGGSQHTASNGAS